MVTEAAIKREFEGYLKRLETAEADARRAKKKLQALVQMLVANGAITTEQAKILL